MNRLPFTGRPLCGKGRDVTRDEALAVLGLAPDATREDITVTYRELAQMLHPDKYGDNKRLRARAEQQMAKINEARDILLKHVSSRTRSRSRATAGPAATASRAERMARAADARAHAAETARLAAVAQLRTVKEIRHRALSMLAIGLIGMLIFSRFRGTFRMLGFPICSTLAVWGVVDIINTSGQIGVLEKRARDLMLDRDAARDVAAQERAGVS